MTFVTEGLKRRKDLAKPPRSRTAALNLPVLWLVLQGWAGPTGNVVDSPCQIWEVTLAENTAQCYLPFSEPQRKPHGAQLRRNWLLRWHVPGLCLQVLDTRPSEQHLLPRCVWQWSSKAAQVQGQPDTEEPRCCPHAQEARGRSTLQTQGRWQHDSVSVPSPHVLSAALTSRPFGNASRVAGDKDDDHDTSHFHLPSTVLQRFSIMR